MQNVDDLGRVIRDRQIRYRHEAYHARLASHPVSRWIGARLVRFGESLMDEDSGEATTSTVGRPPR